MGKKFIFLLFFFLLFLFDINPQNNFWEKISGPFGGRIYSLTKDPIGNIFCGTTRGIFKTENFGENWFSYSFKPDQVQDFIYINDDSLLVLSFPNTYKSTDGGITWDSLLSSDGIKNIYSNNGYIILGAEDYTVMISNDFGENWDVKRVKEYSWPFTPGKRNCFTSQ